MFHYIYDEINHINNVKFKTRTIFVTTVFIIGHWISLKKITETKKL